ncbi:MAG: orotate phosphoribosyltransferase [Bacteroidetes bacterium HGW-Bacteroidetes-1]|jgi:orotate phosphoribosyltransferase|nr:MAG: orotate phosphoribosyltransferase [Bacteroidetes bacterium HGW-Bacteroidetes-1]
MNTNDQSSQILAGFLLQIKAIKLNPSKPFTWASGLKSPIYCDNRITLSYHKIRTYIRQEFVRLLLEQYEKPDLIAGVATGGIAQGVLVAQELGLPFVYVRSEKKSHGLTNQIEGVVETGQSVIVIEDLISTGGSSLNAIEALREAGADVKGMIAIFTYGLKIAHDNFSKASCALTTLTNFDALLQKAMEENFITDTDLRSLMSWKLDPKAWSDLVNNGL